MRSLVGHTARALSTVESYLGQPKGGVVLDGPLEYFAAAFADVDPSQRVALDRQIEARGRAFGAELGDNPAAAFRTLGTRVLAIVDAASKDEWCGTPYGDLRLEAYLPTRSFELAVHGLDLARAIALPAPEGLSGAIGDALILAGRLAARSADAPDLLLLLTGRTPARPGLSVL